MPSPVLHGAAHPARALAFGLPSLVRLRPPPAAGTPGTAAAVAAAASRTRPALAVPPPPPPSPPPPPRARGGRPPRAVAWTRPGRGALSAARVRAAAGAGAAVCCAAAWDVAAVVVAARAAGGAVYVGRGGWDGRRVVAALAARAVRCVLVDEGGVVVGVGGVLLAGAASVDGGRALGARPVVVEVENGLRVEYTEEEGRKGRGGRLTRKRDRDERPAAERVLAFLRRVYLPAGFPATVSSDYLSYTAYRVTQNLASAIMTVLSTECLLYSVGLGGKVKATAAASAWVLKDGLGYLTKVIFGSVCGRQFDLDPKSWRVAADIVEDVGGAVEVIMPLITFPGSFVIVASFTNVLKGAAAMTGTATRHVIYRQLTAGGAENIGDVATKGESQGVTCKAVGLLTGVIISKRLGQNYPALLAAYGAFAVVHLAANWRSMECVQFSFFNKQRLSIALRHALDGSPVPSPLDVSKEERIILPPWVGFQGRIISIGAAVAAAVESAEQFRAGRALFKGEKFIVTRSRRGKLHILLRRDATSDDSVRAYYTAQMFLRVAQVNGDARKIVRLSEDAYAAAMNESLLHMKANIRRFLGACRASGWNTSQMLLVDSGVRAIW